MLTSITGVALVVREYDEALDFYVNKLGFVKAEDVDQGDGKRWVTISPAGGQGTRILLARATTEEQRQSVGRQTGGRVFLFVYTDDFQSDYERFSSHGINFTRGPKNEPYGTVAVFEDLYGNLWDLIQPTN